MDPVSLPLCAPNDSIDDALERLAAAERVALVLDDGATRWLLFIGQLRDARDAGQRTLGEVQQREELAKSAVVSQGHLELIAPDAPLELNPLVPPTYPTADVSVALTSLAFDPLIRLDEKGTVVPVLAVDVPTEENGGITEDAVTFHLRPSTRWHDDTLLTSEDVATSWTTFAAHGKIGSKFDLSNVVEHVETPDEGTISFRIAPFARYEAAHRITDSLLSMSVAPARKKRGDVIGTGAFKVTLWDPGRRIELAANAHSVFGPPVLAGLTIATAPRYPSSTMLQSADVDALLGSAPNLYSAFALRKDRSRTELIRAAVADVFRPAGGGAAYRAASTIAVMPQNQRLEQNFNTRRGLRCDGRKKRHRYPEPPASFGQECFDCEMLDDPDRHVWWE